MDSTRLDEARLDIERASDQFLGLSWNLILGLSNQALDGLLAVDGERYAEKSYVASRLLACEAKVREADDPIGASELYLRAMRLLLRAFTRMDDELKVDASSVIDQSLEALREEPLSPQMLESMVMHYESRCEFSKAEDLLFRRAENEIDEVFPIAAAFYERAWRRSDEELERGNLPRKEVQEGIHEFRARYGPRARA